MEESIDADESSVNRDMNSNAPDIYENWVEYVTNLRSQMFGENSEQKVIEKQVNSGDKSEKFSFAGWLSTSNANPKSIAGETACF